MSRGTLSSVVSSAMFGGLFFLTVFLDPLPEIGVWAWRMVVAVPILWLILKLGKQMHLFSDIWHRMKKKPLLFLGVFTGGFLLSAQIWVFTWGPLRGRALEVSLGYFLLPLVLVIVGRFLYKDRMRWWHWAATGVATVGVLLQVINVGRVSWETLFVCLGYPFYFILRRKLNTASTGGMLWEFIAVTPIALGVIIYEFAAGTAFTTNPALFFIAPTFAFLTAIGTWLYVLASKLLPISLFGLLSYVEPALLVVASLFIGERIAPQEYATYGLIWLAVLILFIGGLLDLWRSKRIRL